MIPSMIHYVWLGRGKKPATFDRVKESWHKYARNFTLREWTEDDLPEFDLPLYFHRAMKDRQWAFASDVLRFAVLERYGGVYLDIDQMLIRNIDTPELLHNHAFVGLYHERDDYCGFGFVGCEKGSEFAQAIYEYYRAYTAREYVIVNSIGSKIALELAQTRAVRIFTQDYFYPLTDTDRTYRTYAYHLSNTSWIPLWKRLLHRIPWYSQLKGIAIKIIPQGVWDRFAYRIRY